jgi:hypothetical protein
VGYDLHDLTIYKFMPKVEYQARVAEAAAAGVHISQPQHQQKLQMKQQKKQQEKRDLERQVKEKQLPGENVEAGELSSSS